MKKKASINMLIVMFITLFLIVFGNFKVNAENRNNNPLLREIIINGDETKVMFDQFVTDYTIATDKEEIKIEAIPDDPNASVKIIGNTKLEIGKNDIEIKVIAEDKKTIQSYFLHITRGKEPEKANANLKDLSIEGVELNPRFNSKDIKYHIEYDKIVDSLNIKATAESKNAKVEIVGNEKFYTGTNHVVNIIVTAEDGITTKTYQIIARKAGEYVEDETGLEDVEKDIIKAEGKQEENNNNTPINIVIIIVPSIILIAIFLKVIMKRKKSKV